MPDRKIIRCSSRSKTGPLLPGQGFQSGFISACGIVASSEPRTVIFGDGIKSGPLSPEDIEDAVRNLNQPGL